ncbi:MULTISPECIES: hypothetical protein [unclassified Bradyrhizobium]|uniref:hypothetical protein n=1 Tax=unclassified Bradyrhizobium TaxID=2631580 RepID=UPI001160A42E|nr:MULTISPECIES: hypothetical protein [unclassified Bradyrhizobium]MBB4381058.1 hypothetical protein [Bradyrhizobium sp. SBR1B]
MGEIVRDAATALSVIEQGALLNVHPVTTRKLLDGPSKQRNVSSAKTGKTGKFSCQVGTRHVSGRLSHRS